MYGPEDVVFEEGGAIGNVLRHGAIERADEELRAREGGLLNRRVHVRGVAPSLVAFMRLPWKF